MNGMKWNDNTIVEFILIKMMLKRFEFLEIYWIKLNENESKASIFKVEWLPTALKWLSALQLFYVRMRCILHVCIQRLNGVHISDHQANTINTHDLYLKHFCCYMCVCVCRRKSNWLAIDTCTGTNAGNLMRLVWTKPCYVHLWVIIIRRLSLSTHTLMTSCVV